MFYLHGFDKPNYGTSHSASRSKTHYDASQIDKIQHKIARYFYCLAVHQTSVGSLPVKKSKQMNMQ